MRKILPSKQIQHMIKIHDNLFVHYSAVLIIICFLLKGTQDSVGLMLISIILHESGHLFMLILCGEKPKRLVLHAFGISIDTPSGMSGRKICITALGGPFLSLILAGLFYFVFPPLFTPNLCVGIINLIPVLPLDGGRIIYSILLRGCARKSSKIIMRAAGFAFGTLIIPLGAVSFITSGYNFSPLLLGVLVFAEGFSFSFSEPVSFVRTKPILGEIYLIPQSWDLRRAADMLPTDGIGAIIDQNGRILRFVTAGELYCILAEKDPTSLF